MDTLPTPAQPENDHEGYALDVNEVAQLLGVTRTRVSQLTTSGILPAERKRIGIRNRLYYKRSDVLNYQHRFFNRQEVGALRTNHYSHSNTQTSNEFDSIGRAGASAQIANEAELKHFAQRAFHSKISESVSTSAEQRLCTAINTLRKQLDKMASKPPTLAVWHEKESRIFESVEQLFHSLEKLNARVGHNQVLQQTSLDEIASIKKHLNHLQQRLLNQASKPELSSAAQSSEDPRESLSVSSFQKRPIMKSAAFRSTVKKRFSAR